jgi:uncharacterized protein
MRKYKLSQNQIDTIVSIMQKHGFTYAGIFGSYVKGKATMYSDVDIAYDHDNSLGLSLFDVIGVKQELEDNLSMEVDFVRVTNLKKRIREEVLASMQLLYDKRSVEDRANAGFNWNYQTLHDKHN